MNSEHPTLTIRRNDTLDTVQKLLGLDVPPEGLPESDPPTYYYHLPELGFWVFFDEKGIVYSIRFDHPYPYVVGAVKIGDTQDDVLRARGNPSRHFPVPDGKARWIYDKPHFMRVDFEAKTNRVEKIFR